MQVGKGAYAPGEDLLELLGDDDAPKTCADLRLPLTPGQQRIADELLAALLTGDVCLLKGGPGSGKTAVLRHIAQLRGGTLLDIGHFIALLRHRSPLAIEETFFELLEQHLLAAHLVIIDDLHLIARVVEDYNYPRSQLFDCALTAILAEAENQRVKLLFAANLEDAPLPIRQRAYSCQLPAFTVEDYEAICRFYFSNTAIQVEYDKVHDFAPALNGYQLKNACVWLRRHAQMNTAAFTQYLSTHDMTSNVDIQEVEPVDWNQLKGVDDVIAELEAKIALPFENQGLARQLQLKPKRGVLLAGPPGTGKTTIGRALAHRLKSKFFLIDGTVVAGSSEFYTKVERVFACAKRNAPSIIFIDDADVIFEDGNQGFYRYLLTMLDGLQSASAERVCVMLTAMEITNVPRAILRSGRIELWLHIRVPAEEARKDILREKLRALPPPLCEVDLNQLAKASRGLTGADLKAVVEDAKLLFAHDQVREKHGVPIEEYFLRAIAGIRSNQVNYRSRKGSSCLNTSIGYPVE